MLAPTLAKQLRERRLATRYKQPTDFVFAMPNGRGIDYRSVGNALRRALTASAVTAPGRLSLIASDMASPRS